MKKCFIFVMMVVCTAVVTVAQQVPPMPSDPEIRTGQLENGLTYYIRHNEEPKGQANFYIAQKVGSILEEESQRGLAHFLEHMCFNGSTHFPGNSVTEYCERNGIQFGADLNAYTSIDETVYNIDNVPLHVVNIIDSCLWILHDWADGLLLDSTEIDKERGVIHEEWRSRNSASQRLFERMLPRMYPNNKYGERLPIGLMSVVDSFPYQVLRDYYEKWYRPDQQGIVVVGDIDVDEIEGKIKAIFNTIATPVDPAERVYTPVEDNKEPIVVLVSDKEMTNAVGRIFIKHDAIPSDAKNGLDYWLYEAAQSIADIMLQQRLDEYINSANPPFTYAGIEDDDYFIAKTKGALLGFYICDENKLDEATKVLYTEMVRAIQNGFTQSEYDRAKAEYLSQIESAYNSRDKKKSGTYCKEIVRHFIDNEPITSAEQDYVLSQQLLPAQVDFVNEIFKQYSLDSNLVVACMLPDKEGVTYPSEEALAQQLTTISKSTVPAYVDKTINEPLLSKLPKAGKIKSTEPAALGYKKITFKNGVVVYLKSTDFDPDDIELSAYSFGGRSLYGENDYVNLKVVNDLVPESKLGNFTKTELTKALSGKQVNLNARINEYTESLSGSSTVKDFETLMQLLYLTFTDIREDSTAFTSWCAKQKTLLLNQEKNPMAAFSDSLMATQYKHSPRFARLKAPMIDQVSYQRCLQIARERLHNPADYTFILTGALDEQKVLPLLAQYLGSIVVKGGVGERWTNGFRTIDGIVTNEFERAMETPKVTNYFYYKSAATKTVKNDLISDITNRILDIIYTREIREKEGGTYGVSCWGGISTIPTTEQTLGILYNTDPDKYVHLNAKIDSLLEDIPVNGISVEDLQKTKDVLLKNYKEALRENSFHQDAMEDYLRYGINSLDDYETVLQSITVEDIKQNVVNLLASKNKMSIIMTPER